HHPTYVFSSFSFLSMLPHQPSSTLFPYTTLFRSGSKAGFVMPIVVIYEKSSGCLLGADTLIVVIFSVVVPVGVLGLFLVLEYRIDRKSTRLNSSHLGISYAVFCLKKKI